MPNLNVLSSLNETYINTDTFNVITDYFTQNMDPSVPRPTEMMSKLSKVYFKERKG